MSYALTGESAIHYRHDPSDGSFTHTESGVKSDFRFLPRKKSFIASDGRVFQFRDIPNQTIFGFQQAFERKHKPKIPTKKYDIGDGDFSYESDPEDAAYKEAYQEYEYHLGLALAAFQVFVGLKFDVPPLNEWSDDDKDLFEYQYEPDDPLRKYYLKYFWLTNSLSNAESDILLRLLQGQKMPTVEGIADAESRFPGDDKRVASTEAPNP